MPPSTSLYYAYVPFFSFKARPNNGFIYNYFLKVYLLKKKIIGVVISILDEYINASKNIKTTCIKNIIEYNFRMLIVLLLNNIDDFEYVLSVYS